MVVVVVVVGMRKTELMLSVKVVFGFCFDLSIIVLLLC